MRAWWYWKVVADKNMLNAASLSRVHFSFVNIKPVILILNHMRMKSTKTIMVRGTSLLSIQKKRYTQFCTIYENFRNKELFAVVSN